MQSLVVAFYFLRRHYPHQVLRVETVTVSSQPNSIQLPKNILIILCFFVNIFFYCIDINLKATLKEVLLRGQIWNKGLLLFLG